MCSTCSMEHGTRRIRICSWSSQATTLFWRKTVCCIMISLAISTNSLSGEPINCALILMRVSSWLFVVDSNRKRLSSYCVRHTVLLSSEASNFNRLILQASDSFIYTDWAHNTRAHTHTYMGSLQAAQTCLSYHWRLSNLSQVPSIFHRKHPKICYSGRHQAH